MCYLSINSLAILMNERIVNELPTIKGFQKMLHSFKMSSAVPIKKYFILFLNRHNGYCSVKCKIIYLKNYLVNYYTIWITLNFTGRLPLTLAFRVIEFIVFFFIKYNNMGIWRLKSTPKKTLKDRRRKP